MRLDEICIVSEFNVLKTEMSFHVCTRSFKILFGTLAEISFAGIKHDDSHQNEQQKTS